MDTQERGDARAEAATVGALGILGAFITRVVAGGAAFTGATLLAGSAHFAAYADSLGAIWLIDVVPISRLFLGAANTLVLTLFVAFVAIVIMLWTRSSALSMQVIRLERALVPLVLPVLILLLTASFVLAPLQFKLSGSLAVSVICVYAGLGCAAAIAIIARDQADRAAPVLFRSLVTALLVTPAVAGIVNAKCDLEPDCSYLPLVTLEKGEPPWRLVLAGEMYILARIDGSPNAPTFRVVPAESMPPIASGLTALYEDLNRQKNGSRASGE